MADWQATAWHVRRMKIIKGMHKARLNGSPIGSNGKQLAAINKDTAMGYARVMWPIVEQLRNQGCTTVRSICIGLNELNIEGPNGNKWHISSTFKLINRINLLKSGEWPRVHDKRPAVNHHNLRHP